MTRSLTVRRIRPDLSCVPRDWAGDPRTTHMLNGLFAVFPDGEMYFCRSVRAFADQTTVSAEELRGFYGQESNHGAAHREAFVMLERQGYHIEDWLEWYRGFAYGRREKRLSPQLRLAVTAALEHLTASLADIAFDPDDIIADVHPSMRELTQWHAAEEIEHRAVAYDVLQQVHPSWVLRVCGMWLALVALMRFGMSAMNHLAKQDGTRGTRRHFLRNVLGRRKVLQQVIAYCKPGFHPDNAGPHVVAEAYLAELDRRVA
jgi:predicted metal-dependent hydrolase